ncbi:MAG: hypothetical protein RL748_1472 [Pseudomonadota bacterium]|jgi:hypothetical protein
MLEKTQEAVSILGKSVGRVITKEETEQVGGGRWWHRTEQTIHNDDGPIVMEPDPVEIWVY